MLGLVFTEFMDMVEDNFDDDVFDTLIETAETQCASAGEYTAVGKYDHIEMATLVTALSEKINVPVDVLVRKYGHYLFGRFNDRYEQFFDGIDTAFDFLKGIEDRIHFEVRKLYPDAELPRFDYEEPQDGVLILHYQSARPFAHLAWGLIDGCIEFFGEQVDVVFEDQSHPPLTKATFRLTKT